MHSFLCFSKIGSLHDIDLYLGLLSLENCDFDSKQLSLPVAISGCRAAPMGANPLGHTFKPLTLYDISIYTIYFSHPFRVQDTVGFHRTNDVAALLSAGVQDGWVGIPTVHQNISARIIRERADDIQSHIDLRAILRTAAFQAIA